MSSAPTRRYDSSKRQARAEESRGRALASASRLFSKHGIDAVTLDQIAQDAGISIASLYAQFRSKSGLLEALTRSVLLGDRYKAAAASADGIHDPIQALRATAAIARAIYESEHRGMGLMRGASAYSPELKKIEASFEKIRWDLQKERAVLIHRSSPAMKELGLKKIRDVLWMFTSRDVYRMLVREQGWSPSDYESWLADTLVKTLMPKGA